jgi:hypothetical protein
MANLKSFYQTVGCERFETDVLGSAKRLEVPPPLDYCHHKGVPILEGNIKTRNTTSRRHTAIFHFYDYSLQGIKPL